MYKLLTKKGQLFALVLGLVSVAIALFSIVGGMKSAGYSLSDDLNQIMKGNPELTFDFFNPALIVVLILIGLAAVAWLVFGLKGLFSNPKASMKFIIAIIAILILVFALYSMAQTETVGRTYELIQKNGISENISKMITAGIKTTLALSIFAVVAMVAMELRNAFK